MKMCTLNLLGFFVFLASLTAICFCKPISVSVHEAEDIAPAGKMVYDARRLWSEAKKAHKQIHQHLEREARQARKVPLKREVRQTTLSEKVGTGSRYTVDYERIKNSSHYMVDLYERIKNSSQNAPFTQANSIKSLTYLKAPFHNSCNKFTFSLGGITQYEFILQAKLRLYLSGIINERTYIVMITVDNSSSNTIKEINPTQSGYIEFEVADIFRPLAGKRKNITFTIEFLQSPPHVIQCEEDVVKFLDSTDEDTIPVLVVYSYDRPPATVNINTDILDKQLRNSNISIEKTEEVATEQTEEVKVTPSRRKRSTRHACTKMSLQVDTSMIPTSLIGNFDNFTVIMPESYNLGICGGRCFNNEPTTIRHPVLIHLLLRYQKFREDNSQYKYTQCCTPVSYKPLTVFGVIGVHPNYMPSIQTIQEMIVDKCECTDVVEKVITT